MASYHHFTSTTFTTLVILFTIFSSLRASDIEFQVGGDSGWVVPPANNSEIYNQWASGERFTVGDTVRKFYNFATILHL